MSIVSFFITLIIQTTLFCRQNVVLARASFWKWGWISGIRHFLKDHKALIYPQILHNHCFQFPLGIKSSSEKSKTTLCIFFRGGGGGVKRLPHCSIVLSRELPPHPQPVPGSINLKKSMRELMRKMGCYSDMGIPAFWAFPFPKPEWYRHPLLILP